jgi:hypothetical protein
MRVDYKDIAKGTVKKICHNKIRFIIRFYLLPSLLSLFVCNYVEYVYKPHVITIPVKVIIKLIDSLISILVPSTIIWKANKYKNISISPIL